MMVKKKLNAAEKTGGANIKKDLSDLIMLCQMAKQIIDKNDDPEIVVGLELAFTTDLITPNGVKINEIVDEDIKRSFCEYSLKVGDKLRERSII